MNTPLYFNLFDQHPWSIKKNTKLSQKAKKSSADKEYINIIKRQNIFITFKLLINRFKYDTQNQFYLPIELWKIIEKPLIEEINETFIKYQDVMYRRWWKINPQEPWSRSHQTSGENGKYLHLVYYTNPTEGSYCRYNNYNKGSIMHLIKPYKMSDSGSNSIGGIMQLIPHDLVGNEITIKRDKKVIKKKNKQYNKQTVYTQGKFNGK